MANNNYKNVNHKSLYYDIIATNVNGDNLANVTAGYGPYDSEGARNTAITEIYGNDIPDGLTTAIYKDNKQTLYEQWYYSGKWLNKNSGDGGGNSTTMVGNYTIGLSPSQACIPVNHEGKCTHKAFKEATTTIVSAMYDKSPVNLSETSIWANPSMNSHNLTENIIIQYESLGDNLKIWLEAESDPESITEYITVNPAIYLLYFKFEGEITLTTAFNFTITTTRDTSLKLTATPSILTISGDDAIDKILLDIDGFDYIGNTSYKGDITDYENTELYLCNLNGEKYNLSDGNYLDISGGQATLKTQDIYNANKDRDIKTGWYIKIVLTKKNDPNSRLIQSISILKLDDIKGVILKSTEYNLTKHNISIPVSKVSKVHENKNWTLTYAVQGSVEGDEYVKIKEVIPPDGYTIQYVDDLGNDTTDPNNYYGYYIKSMPEDDGTIEVLIEGSKYSLYLPIYLNELDDMYNVSVYPTVIGRENGQITDDRYLNVFRNGIKLESSEFFNLGGSVIRKNDDISIQGDLIDEGTLTIPVEYNGITYEFKINDNYIGSAYVSIYDVPEKTEQLYDIQLDNDVVIIDDDSYKAFSELTETTVSIYPKPESGYISLSLVNCEESNLICICDEDGNQLTRIDNLNTPKQIHLTCKQEVLTSDMFSVKYSYYNDNGECLGSAVQSIKIIDINDGQSYRLNISPNIIPLLYDASGNLKVFGTDEKLKVKDLTISATEFIGTKVQELSSLKDIQNSGYLQVLCNGQALPNEINIDTLKQNLVFSLLYHYGSSWITVDKETVGYTLEGKPGTTRGTIELTSDSASFDIDCSKDAIKNASRTGVKTYLNDLQQEVFWTLERSSELVTNKLKIQYKLDNGTSVEADSLNLTEQKKGKDLQIEIIKSGSSLNVFQGYITIKAYETNNPNSLIAEKILRVNAYDIPGSSTYKLNVIPNVITVNPGNTSSLLVFISVSEIGDIKSSSSASLSNFILKKQSGSGNDENLPVSSDSTSDLINEDTTYKLYYRTENEDVLIDSESVGVIHIPAAKANGILVYHSNSNVLIDDNSTTQTLAITTKNTITVYYDGKKLTYGSDYSIEPPKLELQDYDGNFVKELEVQHTGETTYLKRSTNDNSTPLTPCSGSIIYTIKVNKSDGTETVTSQLNITVMDYSDGMGFNLMLHPNVIMRDYNYSRYTNLTHFFAEVLCLPENNKLKPVSREPAYSGEYAVRRSFNNNNPTGNWLSYLSLGEIRNQENLNNFIYPEGINEESNDKHYYWCGTPLTEFKYNSVEFQVLYYSEALGKAIIVDSQTVPIISEGKPGQSITGSTIRFLGLWSDVKKNSKITAFQSATCDNRGSIPYIDVIYLDETIQGCDPGYYQCILSHSKTELFYATKWQPAVFENFLATNIFMAENAQIKFGLTNQLLLQDDNQTIVGGAKGAKPDDDNGLIFWAGSKIPITGTNEGNQINIENSPFRVYNTGRVVAENAQIKGDVEATSFTITPTNETSVKIVIWTQELRDTYNEGSDLIGVPVLLALYQGLNYLCNLTKLSSTSGVTPMLWYRYVSNTNTTNLASRTLFKNPAEYKNDGTQVYYSRNVDFMPAKLYNYDNDTLVTGIFANTSRSLLSPELNDPSCDKIISNKKSNLKSITIRELYKCICAINGISTLVDDYIILSNYFTSHQFITLNTSINEIIIHDTSFDFFTNNPLVNYNKNGYIFYLECFNVVNNGSVTLRHRLSFLKPNEI